jgi:hypothetical protein
MEYYESTQVPQGGDSASGNGVQFSGIGRSTNLSISGSRGMFYMPQRDASGSGGKSTHRIIICNNGVPNYLDIYTNGSPYPIS